MNAEQPGQRIRIGQLALRGRRAVVGITVENQGFEAVFLRLPDGTVSDPTMTAGAGPDRGYRADLEPVFWETARAFRARHLPELDELLPRVPRKDIEEALRKAGVPAAKLKYWDGVRLVLVENYPGSGSTMAEALKQARRHDFGIDIGCWVGRLDHDKGRALRDWLDERTISYTRPRG